MDPVSDPTAKLANVAVPSEVVGRHTIVTALPLKRAARERLAQLLGARVLDIRDECDHPDMVLSPPCSPQLIGGLQRKYGGARVVIVELEDWEFDIDLVGPVKRLLRTGASAYVLADSLEELAAKLGASPSRANETDETKLDAPTAALTTHNTVDELIETFVRQSVEYAARHQAPG